MTTNISRRAAIGLAQKSLLMGVGAASGMAGLILPAGTANALSPPTYRRVGYEIIGGGQNIGSFTGQIQGNQRGTMTATTRVVINSDIYSVEATNVETWTNGVLTRLTGTGTDNRKAFAFDITGNGSGLSGQNDKGRSVRSAQTAIPTTYWNRDFRTTRSVINTLAGTDFAVRATELGQAQINTGFGDIMVDKVRIQGRGFGLYNVVLSYDGRGDWTGLEFSIFGFDVFYRRIS